MIREEAIELIKKLADEQEVCWKAYDKSRANASEYFGPNYYKHLDMDALKRACYLGTKITKLRFAYFIPCVRSGRKYRYVLDVPIMDFEYFTQNDLNTYITYTFVPYCNQAKRDYDKGIAMFLY